MTLRKKEDIVIEKGSTRSQCMENLLWKRLWTCHKTDYRRMNDMALVEDRLAGED
jgi:hypothetical protein